MESNIKKNQISQELFNLITKDKNLEKILNLGEKLLLTPISYTNTLTNYNVVSKGYPRLTSSTSSLSIQNKISEHDVRFMALLGEVPDSTPFIITTDSKNKALVSKVYYCENSVGYLYIPESNIPLESLDIEIIMQIGNSSAVVDLLRDSLIPIEESSRNEHIIFEQLLDRKYKTITDFNFVSKNYSFKNYTQFYILCISLPSDPDDYLEERLNHRSENYNVGLWYKIDQNLIIAMIGLNRCSISIHDLLSELKQELKTKDIMIGISDPFTHILATHDYFKNAESTLLYAKKTNRNKKIHLYDDYKFKTFLKEVNPFIPTATTYISYKVMDILHYDLNNKTDYANTLRTYLSASLSPQATSEILFIHKNTVIYRINKIKELFNIDFSDAEQCFQLYFSFQLLITRGWE